MCALTVSNQGVHRGDVSPPHAVAPGHHAFHVDLPKDPGQVPEQRRVFPVLWGPEGPHQVPEGGDRVGYPRRPHV